MLFPPANSAPGNSPNFGVVYEIWPHLLPGTTGSGKDAYLAVDASGNLVQVPADPFVHPDGTAGMQTAVDMLNSMPGHRGGGVRLTAAYYLFTSTAGVRIKNPAIYIKGNATGLNDDPNAEFEGISGTKIKFPGFGFQLGNPGVARVGCLGLEGIYFWGVDKTNTNGVAILVDGPIDQCRFTDLNFGNTFATFAVVGQGNLDTCYFTRYNALNCAYGVVEYSTNSSYFVHFTDCCLSDLDYHAIRFTNTGNRQFDLKGMTIARAARAGGDALVLYGQGHELTAVTVRDSGYRYLASAYTNSNANGIVLNGNRNKVNGGHAVGSAASGVLLIGSFNTLVGVNFRSTSDAPGENKLYDYYVQSGERNQVSCCGEYTILDEGQGTIIEGESTNAGDPDTQGYWGNVNKDRYPNLKIYDTDSNTLYQYNKRLPVTAKNPNGKRRILATN